MRIAPLLALMVVGCGGRVGVAPRPSPRGVIIQGSTQKYPVSGRTIEQITRSLSSAQQLEGGIGHYQARWRFRYDYTTAMGPFCAATNVCFDVQSIIRIPEWDRPDGADSSVATAWDRFISALDDHEREHERIALESTGDLVREIERLREPSCNQLGEAIRRQAEYAGERMDTRQRRLDADTRNGATTGAVWPPN